MEDRAPLQQMVPVRIGTRQSADLESKDDPDVVEIHLRHDPLKTGPCLGGGGCLRLIVVHDHDSGGGPAPCHREMAESALNISRFFVVGYLILARLANVDDRQSFKVPRLDLAWSGWERGASAIVLRGLEGPRSALAVGSRSGVFMIALLPVSAAEPLDESLRQSAEDAMSNRLRYEPPAEIGPDPMMWF